MLKFNLTQEGKGLIDALQGDAKLAITKVLLLGSEFASKEITSFKGAVCNDGTGNGAYVVIDINDNSNSNYSCTGIELFSDQTKIATQCANEQSGYEVTLYCGERGRNTYPSVTYRTQTWTSGKTPTNIQLSRTMAGEGKQFGVGLNGGGASTQAFFDLENGNFPKTITFKNGDVWVTNETVSATGATEQADYYASSEMGETSIRPLFSKVLIQKDSNKQLKLRVSCQFDGAEKCKFNTTSINLPYATRFREGVIRLADPSEVYGKDGQRYNTVYSAKDVDDKINAVTGSLGNLKDYAKINAENTFAENNTFTKNVTVNGEIGGTAVTDAGTDGDKHIVNVGYADGKYLSKEIAAATYLTKNDAGTIYLTKEAAEQAAANYAKLNADNNFAANTTNTFNGDVTVKGTFAVVDSQDAATFMVTGDGISGTAIQSDKVVSADSNLLPTEGAVKSALDSVKTELTEKDNDLQSQIDGINAGQNLADIVDTTEALKAYDVSHLKAKGDYQHGTSGATWKIGDKVQVLGDANVQSSVYELIKGTKPEGETNSIQSENNAAYYWHYIGVYGTNAYTKAEIDTKVNAINSTLGTKADTSYVSTELAKKVDKTQIATTISDATATDEKIPSGSAVKTYVDTELGNKANSADVYSKTEADGKFAQLVADNTFIGSNTFNGTISGTAVAAVAQPTDDGRKLVTVDYVNDNCAKIHDDNVFSGKSNTFQAITATTVSAQAFTGDGVTASQMNDDDITQSGDKIVSLAFAENRYVKQDAISNKSKIGAMGLFLYTGGDFQAMGADVHGSLLHTVGMQLPMDGVVSWSQGTAVSTAAAETTWKLLNNTIAGEPCLVLAIRVG